MRKILVISIIAVLLVLALSVPAIAEPADPPNAWGQWRAFVNELLRGNVEVPWEEDGEIYYVNNWGYDFLQDVKAYLMEEFGLSWGKYVKLYK